MINDVAIPLSWRGRGLCLTEFSDLSESHPRQWIDLVYFRAFAIGFAKCSWGNCDIPVNPFDFEPISL
jgi:hypothetical protein